MKACGICGKSIEHRHNMAKWCSNQCAEKARGAKYPLRRMQDNQRRMRTQRYIDSIKETTPCQDCGQYFDAICMDFDHRQPAEKILEVSVMRARAFPRHKILTEMAKCDLVCACCHRMRSRDRKQYVA